MLIFVDVPLEIAVYCRSESDWMKMMKKKKKMMMMTMGKMMTMTTITKVNLVVLAEPSVAIALQQLETTPHLKNQWKNHLEPFQLCSALAQTFLRGHQANFCFHQHQLFSKQL